MLAIFDLDGVLIDSKEIHFQALNSALLLIGGGDFLINVKEHKLKYDGISTREKLELLNLEKGLPREQFEKIWSLKQEFTQKFFANIDKDKELIEYFTYLKSSNVQLALASNSIKKTIDIILTKLGVIDFFSLILSNQDVVNSKPHPEIYWKCMIHFGETPNKTYILEDSYIGRLAAQRSGANLIPIDDRSDLTWGKIKILGDHLAADTLPRIPWRSETLNVLIPMAGAGERFAAAGYTFPKPLIEVHGKPMIQVVIENLNIDANFIYLVQRKHLEKYQIEYLLNLITPNCQIVLVDGLTEGAACTTLLAKKYIDNNESLLIANSDQFIQWDSSKALYYFMSSESDGGLLTFNSTHPKWSFVRLDEDGLVKEVAEKKPISDIATTGIYFWKKGSDYVKYAESMINKNIRTNGEFYVCPVFNEAILEDKKFRILKIDKMWGLGTPEDLKYFLENFTLDR